MNKFGSKGFVDLIPKIIDIDIDEVGARLKIKSPYRLSNFES